MTESQIATLSQESANYIRQQWPSIPHVGIILGTGAGALAKRIAAEAIIPFDQIPHFPRSTALGHKGQLVCGQLANRPIIAMQGRFHLYEGYPYDIATLPIHVLHRLGVEYLVVTNASGGINPMFESGQIMAIDSHIDLMFRSSPFLSGPTFKNRSVVSPDCYRSEMIEQAIACGRQHGFPVHRGVYASMLGPNYETRAEYRFLRRIGADVVGMSTVPEVNVAAQYGMRVLGLSIIANVAKPDVLESTSGQEVIDLAKIAGPQLLAIVVDAIERY